MVIFQDGYQNILDEKKHRIENSEWLESHWRVVRELKEQIFERKKSKRFKLDDQVLEEQYMDLWWEIFNVSQTLKIKMYTNVRMGRINENEQKEKF